MLMKTTPRIRPHWILAATALPGLANPIITEIADPNNASSARYVEVYNPTGTVINLSLYELIRWTNGNPGPQSPVSLSGNLAPGEFVLYVADATTFNNTYAGVTASVVQIGTGGPADSNGDDNIAIQLASNSSIVDIFGVPGEHGSGTAHEFEDGRAERAASSTTASATWIAGDWNVDNDSGGGDGPIDAPAGFDPGKWIGAVASGPVINVTATASSITENTTDPDLIQVSLIDASGLTFPLTVTVDALPAGVVNLDGNPDSTTLNFTADTETFDVSVAAIDDSDFSPTFQVSVTATGPGLTAGNENFDLVDDETISPGDIVITEIMQNPNLVGDGSGEWFEVYNGAAFSVDLNGWTIGTEGHLIANGTPLRVAPGSYVVLGNNPDILTNGGVTVDYQYSGVTLGNGSDTLTLSLPDSTEIDRVEYDGGPAFPDPTGASMALISNNLDNNVGANWVTSSTPFGDGDLGSPGAATPTPANLTLAVDNATFSESAGFSASTLTITRSDTTGDLDVTVFSSDSSEALVQLGTVTISDGDADETVDIDAIDDLWPDGDQTVTITATAPGFIGDGLSLTVEDDADTLGLIINEVYYAPDGSLLDANGDGITPSTDDEFIEIVNVGATPFDLSFCSIIEGGFDFNARGPAHVFPDGTILAPGAAIVIFGGSNIADGSTAAFGTAQIQKATEGGLFLSDGGDNVRLRNSFDEELYGVVLPDQTSLGASGSLTLSPDLTPAGGYIPHTTTRAATEFSPGTQTDGTPFVTISDSLTLVVNTPSLGEESPIGVAAITVSLPSPAAADTTLLLESSDDNSLLVPDTATILMGESSVDVDIFPVDEMIEDGDQSVTVTASLSGFLNGSGSLTIVNDDVTFTDLVINEVDADTTDAATTGSTDQLEFIELFNKTGSSQSLTGLIVVLFNGSDDASYQAIDLSGLTIPANGFFVIGNTDVPNVDLVLPGNTIQNGPDAVALISGDVTNFPTDTPVGSFTGTLIDAVVYGTNDGTDAALIAALTPSGAQLDEGSSPDSQTASNARSTDGGAAFDTTVWVAQTPTPGATNVLPVDGFSTWAADQVPPIIDGPDGDPDGDGIRNLIEYALGLDPNAAGGSPGSLSGGVLTFTKGADAKANGDVIYEIETSTDLGVTDPWAANGSAVDGADDISLDILTAGGAATEFFARLKVSQSVNE